MANECSNSENLFPAYNQHENLQEDIQRINLELNEKNQEISRNNLELNKKYYQEISRNNSNLIKENEKILRTINNDLKEKLQNINEQFEKLQKDLNLEKQKNKEIQRLEVISQNLEKNLKILEVDEIDNNTINVFKENNEQKNCNINNNRTTFALNYSKGLDVRVIVGLDFGVTYSGFAYCHVNDDYQDIHTNDIWPMAITDYLREIGMVIKGTIECRWDKDSEKLQLTTESKATALYCVKHCFKRETGETFIGDDITHNEKNCKFKTLVERDTKITPEQTFSFNFKPESNQARGSFAIYYTRKYNIEYCDELGTKLLGILNIDLLDSVHLDNGSINFELTFGQYEIIASARNENGQEHMTTFCYPADYDF
ncbi:unnamed protein product [Rhizophagus irregularis]|nr:unnamed protein product [Rhizophagus irregularis]